MLRHAPWLLSILLLSGCLREPQQLTSHEIQRVVWFSESVAHGLERDPYELVNAGATEGMQNIALWALGHVEDITPVRLPSQLESRARRWPLLREGLRRGALQIDRDGLLRVADALEDEERELYRDAVESENLDRLAVASLLLSRGQLVAGSQRAAELLGALRQTRLDLALRAGGTLFQPPPEETEPLPVRPERPRRAM